MSKESSNTQSRNLTTSPPKKNKLISHGIVEGFLVFKSLTTSLILGQYVPYNSKVSVIGAIQKVRTSAE